MGKKRPIKITLKKNTSKTLNHNSQVTQQPQYGCQTNEHAGKLKLNFLKHYRKQTRFIMCIPRLLDFLSKQLISLLTLLKMAATTNYG